METVCCTCLVQHTYQRLFENCVLTNLHNTQIERDRNNRKRKQTRARAASSRQETIDRIEEIDLELKALTQNDKNSKNRRKELQEKKKSIQDETGLKKSPKKQPTRGKIRFPAAEDLTDDLSHDFDGYGYAEPAPYRPEDQVPSQHQLAQAYAPAASNPNLWPATPTKNTSNKENTFIFSPSFSLRSPDPERDLMPSSSDFLSGSQLGSMSLLDLRSFM